MIALGARSHYSWRLGTASPDRLVRHAHALGYTHLALTDRDNLCGLWSFLRACEEQGITPIVGAEVTEPGPTAQRRRAFCLVENDEGYRSLCRLISASFRAGFSLRPAVGEHRQGLCVLSENADDLLAWHQAGVTVAAGVGRKPEGRNHPARQLARQLGLPLVAVLDNVGLRPEDHALHRVLRAIAGNTEFSWLDGREVFPEDAFFPAPDEFARRFATCPEALDGTRWVAERCTFRHPRHGLVLPPYATDEGRSAAAVLREQAYAGATGRYGDDLSEAVVERLNYELGRIEEKGFSSYFLVVRDIVRRSPRICGRGSGAASLVAYCLGITNVCPIRHNLYFERFLNPARQDPPDIDVDFAWDERDAVIDSVLAEHGSHAAMVSSHVLFQPRMAIREVAKVFGLPDGEIGRVVGKMPWFWHQDGDDGLLASLEKMPELKTQEFPDPWPEIVRLAEALIGIPRHISVHPGGTIITPRPVDDYVPVQIAPKGVPIIQWDKDGAEDGGLVKIDLLGNRSLAVIRDAMANLRENGLTLHEATWDPEKDPATMRAVARGLTMGCFYIESPAMRLLQQKAGVGDFEHLVIHSSIIRPAANLYINEYLRRLKGGAWQPIHPLLADGLDETFGIMVYQEDVSKAAVAMAGFSHSDADALRKILTKRDRENRLADWRRRFQAGAREHGVSDAAIEEVWAMMMSFDGYSFCKPHSASYARVSFQAAYLKVHFPAEMMAAVLSNQGGFYNAFAYVSESRRMGLTVQPPDVNASQITWRGRGKFLRVALQALSGLSVESARRIVDRRASKPFTSFDDFMRRVRPDAEEARALILAGACDTLLGLDDSATLAAQSEARARLMWMLAQHRQVVETAPKGRAASGDLFATRALSQASLPALPPGDPVATLRRQFGVLGFLCDRHPISLFAQALAARPTVPIVDLRRYVGRHVRVAGWLITGKVIQTKHGEPMEFLTFEDESGILETTFFPNAYRQFCDRLDHTRPFWLTGKVEEEYGALTLTVDGVEAVTDHSFVVRPAL